MHFELSYLVVGALLLVVALVASSVQRLPMTETMIYLAAGLALGPLGFGLFSLDPLVDAGLLERLAEVAVIISLFTTGLKLRAPWHDPQWQGSLRLAFVSMVLTVGLITLVGIYLLKLPLGAAVLLGGILAPTDPVLASDVQMEDVRDEDRLRLGLTGEAGLNDGTAFPFVMLGLSLCGLHEIGAGGWRWWTVDVLWGIVGGLAIGAACGSALGHLVIYLRREHREGHGRDEILTLGLIALAYGAALLAHAYGFLSVFAAGLALRAVERRHTGEEPPEAEHERAAGSEPEEAAAEDDKAPARMAKSVLSINEQTERVMEVALVLVIGAAFSRAYLRPGDWWFIAVLLLVVRPVAVQLGLVGSHIDKTERGLMSWFGIRGIGSLYYLMYSVHHGLPENIARRLISLTLMTIAVSIIIHGITVTPLMHWRQKREGG